LADVLRMQVASFKSRKRLDVELHPTRAHRGAMDLGVFDDFGILRRSLSRMNGRKAVQADRAVADVIVAIDRLPRSFFESLR